MTSDDYLATLRTGSRAELQALVASLPDNAFKATAAGMIGSGSPGMDVVMLAPMITRLCAGQNPALGAPLALAAHARALELYEKGGDHGLLPTTLSGLASNYVNACNGLGHFEATVLFTESVIPYYEALPEPENLRALKTGRINALISLNRIDDADAELQDPTLPGHWSTDMEVSRLKRLVAQIKSPSTATAGTPDTSDGGSRDDGQLLIDALKGMIGAAFDDPSDRNQLLDAASELDPSNRIDPSTPQGQQQLLSMNEMFADFLAGRKSPAELVRELADRAKDPDVSE